MIWLTIAPLSMILPTGLLSDSFCGSGAAPISAPRLTCVYGLMSNTLKQLMFRKPRFPPKSQVPPIRSDQGTSGHMAIKLSAYNRKE